MKLKIKMKLKLVQKTGRKFIHIADIISGIIKSSKKRGIHILNLTGNKLITLDEIIKKVQMF